MVLLSTGLYGAVAGSSRGRDSDCEGWEKSSDEDTFRRQEIASVKWILVCFVFFNIQKPITSEKCMR